METSILVRQTTVYRRTSFKGTPQLNFKPFSRFFSSKPIIRLSRWHSWHINSPAYGVSNQIFATAEPSKRKPRKEYRRRSRSPSKGVMPNAPAGAGAQKKERVNREKSPSASSARRGNRKTSEAKVDTNDAQATEILQGMRFEEEKDDVINGKAGIFFPESELVAVASENELKGNGSIRGIVESPTATLRVEERVGYESGTALFETELEEIDGTNEFSVFRSGINKEEEESSSTLEFIKSENEFGTALVWTTSEIINGSGGNAFVESEESREVEENASITKLISEYEAPVMARSYGVYGDVHSVILETDKTKEADVNVVKTKLISENGSPVASVATKPEEVDASVDDAIVEIDSRVADEDVDENSETCLSDIVSYHVDVKGDSSQVLNAEMDAHVHQQGIVGLTGEASVTFTSEAIKEGDDNIYSIGVEESRSEKGPDSVSDKVGEEEDFSHDLKLEMEALVHKEVVDALAKDNFSRGSKLFTYPHASMPGQDIEVYLNRSYSTLKHEPDVMIKGAFNDWRWESFTRKLHKSHLSGDWWSCRIHVPKEAYQIDFVFFNGKDLYENNDRKDFHISVEGGIDADAFEDLLIEKKRSEVEKLAKEQAERERQEAEKRRLAEESAAKEADRTKAKLEVQRRRDKLVQLMNIKATKAVDNICYFEPRNLKNMDLVRLYYNKSSGPLARANDIWMYAGYNSWKDGHTIVAKLVKSERMDADWWYAEVTVPDRALILDWVFADGPPKSAHCYDNNHRHDFHAVVANSLPEEIYWAEEEHQIYQELQDERRQRELTIHVKAEQTAHLKAETKEKTLKRFLLCLKHIVYTEPLDVRAGIPVTVYYNPANTVLNGKPEIWFRCSFNRWTHQNGPLPPQKMVPAGNGSHFKATVKVPLNSYLMDFVFSEREDGGIFDNKDGMDYHVPVHGGNRKEPPMHIVHIAVEMAPIAKVGGLGDVVTSLSRAVQDLNHNVNIILPKYDCLTLSHIRDLHCTSSFSWGGTEIKVWFGKVEGLSVYFLEPQNGFFWKGCVYGCGNDAQRFGFFCHAALEFLHQTGLHPDIIHCHDWSSAPVAWLCKDHYSQYGLSKARVVFTIHNLEFGEQLIGKAMAYSDKATTVSHTYSKEVAGNPAIAPHLFKFHGIINGIDPDLWDPYNDKFIPVPYMPRNVIEGKKAAKEALQRRLGLKVADIPVVGIISRLTHQKGIHLIKHAIWRALERNGQAVLLGSAPDPRIQNDFVNLANQLHSSHNDRARFCLTYDEPLSHLIYAGADFIVVPSIFEPCGLTQLVAMRYGSVPVVRKTGGLYDTVYDVDHDKERAEAQGLEPNGFSFEGADAAGLDYALNRAISAWYDGRDWFNSLCKRVMEQDWSWNRPALDYLELYHAARKY